MAFNVGYLQELICAEQCEPQQPSRDIISYDVVKLSRNILIY